MSDDWVLNPGPLVAEAIALTTVPQLWTVMVAQLVELQKSEDLRSNSATSNFYIKQKYNVY